VHSIIEDYSGNKIAAAAKTGIKNGRAEKTGEGEPAALPIIPGGSWYEELDGESLASHERSLLERDRLGELIAERLDAQVGLENRPLAINHPDPNNNPNNIQFATDTAQTSAAFMGEANQGIEIPAGVDTDADDNPPSTYSTDPVQGQY
jgi:hypothetical protein